MILAAHCMLWLGNMHARLLVVLRMYCPATAALHMLPVMYRSHSFDVEEVELEVEG